MRSPRGTEAGNGKSRDLQTSAKEGLSEVLGQLVIKSSQTISLETGPQLRDSKQEVQADAEACVPSGPKAHVTHQNWVHTHTCSHCHSGQWRGKQNLKATPHKLDMEALFNAN